MNNRLLFSICNDCIKKKSCPDVNSDLISCPFFEGDKMKETIKYAIYKDLAGKKRDNNG